MSEAMRIFLNQCIDSGGLPFKLHIKFPNKKTMKAFEEVDNQTTTSSSTEKMFKKLGIKLVAKLVYTKAFNKDIKIAIKRGKYLKFIYR